MPKWISGGLGLVPALALGGVEPADGPRPGGGGDWCRAIPADWGVLADESGAGWLQDLQVGAFVHHQSAFVDGTAGGRGFWYGRGSDWRRGRLTLKARAFDALSVLVQANMIDDDGRDGGGVEVDYRGLFQAWAQLDLVKLVRVDALDGLSIAYGKRKLTELSEEIATPANAILTVERSALAGQLAPLRAGTGATGAWLKGGRGRHRFSLGLFTTDVTPELGNWSDGTLLVGAWSSDFAEQWGVDEARFSLGGGVQDVERGDEVYSTWEWVVTPWLRWRSDRWELRLSGAVGENEGPPSITGGGFHGITVMPSYWLVEDRLQAVARYQMMASRAPRGVGMASRYAREAGRLRNEALPALALGRGDRHQSIYGGLAWLVCPNRLHLLAGLEWDRLDSRDIVLYEGLTGWLAVRLIF